jgi:hypothetical protein
MQNLTTLSANYGWRINSCRQTSGFSFDQSQRSANSGRRDNIRAQAKPPSSFQPANCSAISGTATINRSQAQVSS